MGSIVKEVTKRTAREEIKNAEKIFIFSEAFGLYLQVTRKDALNAIAMSLKECFTIHNDLIGDYIKIGPVE